MKFIFKHRRLLELTVLEFLPVDTDGNQIIKSSMRLLQKAALLRLAAERDKEERLVRLIYDLFVLSLILQHMYHPAKSRWTQQIFWERERETKKWLLSQRRLKIGLWRLPKQPGERKAERKKQRHRWTCRCSSPLESAAAVNIHCVEFFLPTKVQRLKMSLRASRGRNYASRLLLFHSLGHCRGLLSCPQTWRRKLLMVQTF